MRHIVPVLLSVLSASAFAQGFFQGVDYLDEPLAAVKTKVLYLPTVTQAAAPVCDGVLDDPVWKEAQHLTGFIDPQVGREPHDAVEAWVARGPDALYMAVKGAVKIPARPEKAQSLSRHAEYVHYLLQPNLAHWGGFDLLITGGSDAWYKGEANTGIVYRKDYIVPDWKPEVAATGACKRDGDGMISEIIIPYATLAVRAPAQGEEWGFDIERMHNYHFPIPNSDQTQVDVTLSSWGGAWGGFGISSTPDKWGRIYFGTEAERVKGFRAPVVRVYADRVRYDNTDEAGEGYVEVIFGSEPASAFAMKIDLLDAAGKAVESRTEVKPHTGAVAIRFDPRKLKNGDYILRAALLRDGREVSAGECKLARYPGDALPRNVFSAIPVNLFNDPRIGMDEVMLPVSIGVPMPKGMFADTSKLVLQMSVEGNPVYPGGRTWANVPAQFDVRDRWYRGGSIRWLGVSFDAKYRAGWPARYQLVWNTKEAVPAFEKPLALEETDAAITVTTGPARFALSKTGFNLISGAWLDTNGNGQFEAAEQLIRAGAEDGLWYENQTQTRMNAAHAGTTLKVVESGPERAVIAAEGWYQAGNARECIQKTRFFFSRNSATVKVKHSWINTADSRTQRVREISLKLGVPGVRACAFGGEDGGISAADVPAGGVYQIQLTSKSCPIETDLGRAAGPDLGRMGGWLYAGTDRGGVSLAGRDLWKLYPKELAVKPGGVALYLWPVHGRDVYAEEYQLQIPHLIQLLTAHQGRELSFQMPKSYYEKLGAYWNEGWLTNARPTAFGPFIFWKAWRGYNANAQGVALSAEIDITLHPAGAGPQAAARAAMLLDVNPHGVADPKWTRFTNAIGPVHEKDPVRFGGVEKIIDDTFQRCFVRQPEELDDYGMLNWPDYHNYAYDAWNPSTGSFHRCWSNSHYQDPRAFYHQYLRSGEEVYWHLANAKFRHAMDIDAVNYGDDPPIAPYHQRAATYHPKGLLHWGGNGYVICHFACYDYMLYDYYLTGDPRGKDFVRMWADELNRDAWVGNPEREATAPLAEALFVYQHLRDPRMLKMLDHHRNGMLVCELQDHLALPYFNYMLWWRVNEYTADPRVRERMVAHWGDGATAKKHGLGHGLEQYMIYKFTGDRRLMAAEPIVDPKCFWPRYTIPVTMAYTWGGVPFIMTGMEEAGASGDVMLGGAAWKTYWNAELEQWRKEGKKVWGK